MAYYATYKNKPYSCYCGWSGIGKETEIGEIFDEGMEIICPRCNDYSKLDFVQFSGNEEDDMPVPETKASHSYEREPEFRYPLLSNINQLPDLNDKDIYITFENDDHEDLQWYEFDTVGEEGDFIVIMANGNEIWREPYSYLLRFHRYHSIIETLKTKYGKQLKNIQIDARERYFRYNDAQRAYEELMLKLNKFNKRNNKVSLLDKLKYFLKFRFS